MAKTTEVTGTQHPTGWCLGKEKKDHPWCTPTASPPPSLPWPHRASSPRSPALQADSLPAELPGKSSLYPRFTKSTMLIWNTDLVLSGCYKGTSYKQQKGISPSFEGWKSEIRVAAGWAPMRTLFKAVDGCFLLVSEQERRRPGGKGERGRESGDPPPGPQDSLKGTDPTHGGSALMPVTSQDAAADPVTPAGFQGVNEGERRHTHRAHSTPLLGRQICLPDWLPSTRCLPFQFHH